MQPKLLQSPLPTRLIPTRDAALQRLADFVANAGERYQQERNFDYGPHDRRNVSNLSPYIRNGLLSEVEVAGSILERHSYRAAEKFIQEVFWRTYWKGYLQNRPAIWTNYTADLNRLTTNPHHADTLQAAQRGKTGIECFDAWAHELADTGYLHNHARMWFASIWIFTLRLPWQLGADYFMRHLLDGDPASNTLSWRWVAGLHTVGKTYLAQPSNIARYTCHRFATARGLAEEALPIAEPHAIPPARYLPLPDAPHQLHPGEGLLLLDEDLRRSIPNLKAGDSILGLYPSSDYERFGLSESVRQFRYDSLAIILSQLENTERCVTTLDEQPSSDRILQWAADHNLKTLVLAEPKVGPWHDLWSKIAPQLTDAGLTLKTFRPWWENELFPHANAGFFKLKSKLPALAQRIAASIFPLS